MLRLSLLVGVLQGCTGSEGPPPAAAELPPLPALVEGPVDRVGEVRDQRELQLFLVGEVRGEIEPCGCPTLPYGGFVRRQALLDQVRAYGVPTFHLDAGETLVKGLILAEEDELRSRAALLAELITEVEVDALVPGPSDLAPGGLAELRRLFPAATSPLVSATWIDEDGQTHFPATRVITRDGVRLGVVGLSRRPTSPEQRAIVGWRDPVDAARDAVASLPAGLDLVVALSNLDDEDNARVAAVVPGLAVVLAAAGAEHDDPRTTEGAPVIEVPGRGRYVTLVRAWLGSGAGEPLVYDTEPAEALAHFDQGRRALHRMRASQQAEPEALEGMEQRVLAAVTDLAVAAEGRNLAVLDQRPLGSGLDREVAVSKRLERYKRDVLREARKVDLSVTPVARGPHYATASACVSCHRQQFARWTFTSHAGAHDALKARGEGDNPECLGCHTLGFGEEGGFGELTPFRLSQYGGVQCEACHGMLAGHPEDTEVRPAPVGPETCLRCHDPANSPEFDYDVYLRGVHCPISEGP